ncbi:MAG: peptide MFS transporter [Bacteroidota bacterium]
MAENTSVNTYDYDNAPQLFGHPVGLYVLFFTELWERFSYYGMRAILVLYMTTKVTADNAGLGYTAATALAIYGWYTMLVYVASIPGGILADKYIGQKRSVMLGGMLLVAGHGILAVEAIWAFYTGLGLIIAGVGCLKPNISTMVGGLYRQGDLRRDQGFTIFYIGINVGAFLSSLIVGFVGETYGWHYGFGLAGIGMLIGQILFFFGQRYLKGVGESPKTLAENGVEVTSLGTLFQRLFKSPTQLIITIVLAVGSAGASLAFLDSFDRFGYAILGIFLSIVIGLLMMIYQDVDKIEKDRFVVLLLSFLIVIVFWGAFEQAGGLMNIYTLKKIDRVVSLTTLDILLFGAGGFLLLRGIYQLTKKKDTAYIFLVIGAAILGIHLYLRSNVFTDPFEIPASVFQSVNAMFIIIFGTLVGAFWIWWRKSGRESSSLLKMAVGTIIMGVGFLFMAKASADVVEYGDRAALILLILAYLLHTLGELCASPVAMSFITKVAPVKYVSIMMGVYFAATGLGNKVAGIIGELSQTETVKVELAANIDQASDLVTFESNENKANFEVTSDIALDNGNVVFSKDGKAINGLLNIDEENNELLSDFLESMEHSTQEPLTAVISMEKKEGESNYSGSVEVFEVQDNQELWTFISIFIFTAIFGFLLILFLKRLKRLTHGAEDFVLES